MPAALFAQGLQFVLDLRQASTQFSNRRIAFLAAGAARAVRGVARKSRGCLRLHHGRTLAPSGKSTVRNVRWDMLKEKM